MIVITIASNTINPIVIHIQNNDNLNFFVFLDFIVIDNKIFKLSLIIDCFFYFHRKLTLINVMLTYVIKVGLTLSDSSVTEHLF